MLQKIMLKSFNAGELSPLLHGQTEFKKYNSGVAIMENFLAFPHGPATMRPGFKFIGFAKRALK